MLNHFLYTDLHVFEYMCFIYLEGIFVERDVIYMARWGDCDILEVSAHQRKIIFMYFLNIFTS